MKYSILRYFSIITLIIFYLPFLKAQYTPGLNNNVTLLSHQDNYQRYSNIWGYIDSLGNEYALIGHNAGTSIVNITNPSNPVEVGMVPGPGGNGTIWREIKTHGKYAYVVSEHTSPESLSGLQIIDLTYLPDSVRYVKRYLWPNVTQSTARAHTVTVDGEGYLYIHGGTATLGGIEQGGIRILSIADPENPLPVSIFDLRYVHDTFIQDTILFASNIYEFPGRIDIISISDRSNPQLIHGHIYQNGFAHNSWTTEDKNYLVQTDEMAGLKVKIFDISVLWDSDPNNNEDIALVSEYISNPNFIAHEPRVKGNYIYISHYGEGARIVDISNPADPVEVGYYDTQPGQGSGAWGIWPFFPSGNFVVSDIQNGLFVLKFDSLNAGGIQGVITSLSTSAPLSNVQMKFVEAGKNVSTNASGNFSFRTNEGEHTIILSKTGFITDTIVVSIPEGSSITQNFSMSENNANLSVSVDSILVNLPVDSTLSVEFLISNTGGSTLNYTLDDIVGPIRIHSFSRNSLSTLKELRIQNLNEIKPDLFEVTGETFIGDTIIVDPAGDLIFGSGGDIITVYAAVSSNSVTIDFEFANDIDTDSTLLIFSLDTDFDQNSGAFPGGFGFNLPQQGIGSEYDIIIDVPGVITFPPQPLSYHIWIGANELPTSQPFVSGSILITDRIITVTIPFSQIGNDDGNMATAGYCTNLDVTSIDYFPDIGNGVIGNNPNMDLPWLTLNPTSGSIPSGNSNTITAVFDSKGLEKNIIYRGYIVVYSNDPNQPVKSLPVILDTGEPVNAEEENNVLLDFSLQQNYPNPFNPVTIIPFSLDQTGNIRVVIYNILGEEIKTLINKSFTPGKYEVNWDGKNNYGFNVTSGVYFYSLEQGSQKIIKKMVLNR